MHSEVAASRKRTMAALLRRHDLRRKTPAASPWHGLLLGNGDLGAVVFGPEHALRFRLNKLDLWDARWPETASDNVLPLSEFKRVAAAESRTLADGERIEAFDRLPWQGAAVPYPCMRTGADLVVGVTAFTGANSPTQRLRLSDAVHACTWRFSHWKQFRVESDAFVCRDRNVLAVRLRANGRAAVCPSLALRRDPFGGRDDDLLRPGEWGVRGWKDPRAGSLPAAEMRCEGPWAVLVQTIPGDADCDPCRFAVVAYCERGSGFAAGPGGEPVLTDPCVDDGDALCYVAMATERDGPNPVERAVGMARQAAAAGYDELYREHRAAWQRFWEANRVELSDRGLERDWYRKLYSLGCHVRPDGPAPGLFGVGLPYDCPPWRGDRHNNWPEYAGLFWGAFTSNHLELVHNYVRHTDAFLPQARTLARDVFECDRGAAFPAVYIDYTRRTYFDNLWARSLYLTAITVQNAWWYYLYSGDRSFLAQRGYPLMAEAADFYVELVAQNPEGDTALWPTVPPEYRGFLKDLALSRNCLIDLAMVKFLLRAVIHASELLGRDPARRDRWAHLLEDLPAYPTLQHEGQTLFSDVEGNTEIAPYNHPIGVAPLFPGEDPDCFGSGPWRDSAEATLRFRNWGDFQQIAYARLGDTAKAFALAGGGKPVRRGEDSNIVYAASAKRIQNIAELLLSSWDGIIRVFPAWPREREASFERLRAVGAFLVSASCRDGAIGPITILSEAGETALVELPWAGGVVDHAPDASIENGKIRFETEPGSTYVVKPASSTRDH